MRQSDQNIALTSGLKSLTRLGCPLGSGCELADKVCALCRFQAEADASATELQNLIDVGDKDRDHSQQSLTTLQVLLALYVNTFLIYIYIYIHI